MTTVYKNVSIPFSINEMETLGEKDLNVYIVSYKDSTLKGVDFIDYLINSSKICDITDFEEIDTKTKISMILRLFNQPEIVFIPCVVKSLILSLLALKGQKIALKNDDKSFLNEEEIKVFLEREKLYFDRLISFFDSLFPFMLTIGAYMVKHPKEEISYEAIIEQYKDIKTIDDKRYVMPNVCSILFDELFYDYYKTPINEDNVVFFKQQYTTPMYNGKTILSMLINDANKLFLSMIDFFESSKS